MATAEGKKHRIGMAEFQRFGGAMLTPVLFFMFSGIVVAVTSVLTNPMLVGEIANEAPRGMGSGIRLPTADGRSSTTWRSYSPSASHTACPMRQRDGRRLKPSCCT